MNVLCVSAFCPHREADSAGAQDVHHMLRFLARRHEVTVVCATTVGDRDGLAELREIADVVAVDGAPVEDGWRYAARSALSLPTALPAIAFLTNDGALRAAIREVTAGRRFDVAHFAFTQTMHLRALLPAGLPAAIDELDLAFERRRRFADTIPNPLVRYPLVWDCVKLKRYELRGLAGFDAVVLRTERDAQVAGGLTRLRRVVIVPPWVDVSFREKVTPRPETRDVLFYAAQWRRVNADAALWLAREVWPRVRERVPDTRLLIVGSRPPAAVRALASETIEVPGYVESIGPYYRRAAVAVAPLRAGSGVRGKVLQALGAGRPVVATTVGAEGIDASANDGLFVRDDPEELAEAVARLATDERPERWHQAGRRWFDATHRWEEACGEWEAVLHELAGA